MSDERPIGGGENKSTAFMDEQDRPLTKSKFEVSEYPEGFNPNEQSKKYLIIKELKKLNLSYNFES